MQKYHHTGYLSTPTGLRCSRCFSSICCLCSDSRCGAACSVTRIHSAREISFRGQNKLADISFSRMTFGAFIVWFMILSFKVCVCVSACQCVTWLKEKKSAAVCVCDLSDKCVHPSTTQVKTWLEAQLGTLDSHYAAFARTLTFDCLSLSPAYILLRMWPWSCNANALNMKVRFLKALNTEVHACTNAGYVQKAMYA